MTFNLNQPRSELLNELRDSLAGGLASRITAIIDDLRENGHQLPQTYDIGLKILRVQTQSRTTVVNARIDSAAVIVGIRCASFDVMREDQDELAVTLVARWVALRSVRGGIKR